MVLKQSEIDARLQQQVEGAGFFLFFLFIKVKVELPCTHWKWQITIFIGKGQPKLNYLGQVNILLNIEVLILLRVTWTRHPVLVDAAWILSVLVKELVE